MMCWRNWGYLAGQLLLLFGVFLQMLANEEYVKDSIEVLEKDLGVLLMLKIEMFVELGMAGNA